MALSSGTQISNISCMTIESYIVKMAARDSGHDVMFNLHTSGLRVEGLIPGPGKGGFVDLGPPHVL